MKAITLAVTSALSLSAFAGELPALKLDLSNLTVSGLSSGGYMAGQFHQAYGDKITGVGIIAAGPYYCAQGSIMTALGQCVNKQDGAIDLKALNETLAQWRQQGLIAPETAIEDDKVWVLHGSMDEKVIAPVTNALVQQYRDWGVEQLTYINDKPFAHHFPAESNGTDCAVSEAPFVGNCGYNAAAEMLNTISDAKATETDTGELYRFNQQELGGEFAESLAETGYVFVPQSCTEGNQCQLHINFHGCKQYAEAVGTDYIEQNGINDWAAVHNTVVLYPQTTASALMPMNPQGCWDWWGYTDEHYATNKGQQVQAVMKMAESLSRE
ncbi:Poly(3-hydroxybutyrate) depolymerase [Saliniradius amylolyticus]|uniref:Poly(3-hydroxybutyrate) depolymerase n=1 Tax=Saliniradius amylolyticus TaxID=2183582 RepID=A0A2S2E3F1_9ALTE|nr:PHB depolymerase family esterase [Saliniradius amylolyticus]AWL11780.1 Poly(3-hydroxybutyrate) depolymerase [Saliniradius amylolyticus]